MEIFKTKNSRLYLDPLGDTEKVGKKDKAKGFDRHSKITGYFLSLIDLSFKDSENGYLNKKSVVHYLKRNLDNINLSEDDKKNIRDLSDDSTASTVENLFNKVKTVKSQTVKSQAEMVKRDIETTTDENLKLAASVDQFLSEGEYVNAFKEIEKMTDLDLKESYMNEIVDHSINFIKNINVETATLTEKGRVNEARELIKLINPGTFKDKLLFRLAQYSLAEINYTGPSQFKFPHRKYTESLVNQIENDELKATLLEKIKEYDNQKMDYKLSNKPRQRPIDQ